MGFSEIISNLGPGYRRVLTGRSQITKILIWLISKLHLPLINSADVGMGNGVLNFLLALKQRVYSWERL